MGLKKILYMIIVGIAFLFILNFAKYQETSTGYAVKNSLTFNLTNEISENLDPIFCGVSFNPPWFEVRDNTNTYLLIIDSAGNFYINSTNVQLNTQPSTNWLNAFVVKVGSTITWAFNKTLSQIAGSIIQSSSPSYDSSDFVVKKADGTILAVFDSSTKNIYIRGIAVYQGAQAGCPADSYTCNGNTREYRDYYCNAYNGVCSYRVTSSENCDNYDGYTCNGNVREYRNYYCSGGACTYSVTSSENCDNYDGYTCNGNVREYRNYYCSGGACTYSVTSSENCDNYDVSNCNNYQKIIYDYYCSGGFCIYSTTVVACDNGCCSSYCQILGFAGGSCSSVGTCTCIQ